MKNPKEREAVLYAFAMEADHGRGTLERYLKEYPDLSVELVDLASELRLEETFAGRATAPVPDPGCDAAWKDFLACTPDAMPAAVVVDPFSRFKGPAFVGLAKALDVPRSILTALRDGLVVASSVPQGFLGRFAEAADATVESVRAYLAQDRQATAGLAFKADSKPSHQGQTTFRQLILNTEMAESQRLLLLRECDEDERN